MKEWSPKFRIALFEITVVLLAVILAVRLWDLQVISYESYQAVADENRFRLLSSDAPRGVIYDRNGNLLVQNVPSFSVTIVSAGLPEDEDEYDAVLSRLGDLLGKPGLISQEVIQDDGEPEVDSIERVLEERIISAYSPVRVATNVDREVAFMIEEENIELPGVGIEVDALREYLYGSLTAHILGYVGSIPSDDIDDYLDDTDFDYEADDLVGLTGIEATQENLLRGAKGEKLVEVDVYERQVELIQEDAAVQGSNLVLTLDVDLQQAVETALLAGMADTGSETGVAIVMNPQNGQVLSMVSLPSYDNNLFSGGISTADYAMLSEDPLRPMVNHAISGLYPPGSTFKIVTATGALESGVVDANTTVYCGGTMYLPNEYFPEDASLAQPFYCWSTSGHGNISLVNALAQSCDIYFYQVAGGFEDQTGMGMTTLAAFAEMFGFGEKTGIPLSAEASGVVPGDKWKRQNYGEQWLTGDTYNAAIGQGYVLVTPMQLLNATSAIANGGTLYQPQLVYQVLDENGEVVEEIAPEIIREIEATDEHIELVREGLHQAVLSGTAYRIAIPGVDIASKTGTAEYAALDENGELIVDENGDLPTHAWITAFAPYDEPEVAVVVFLAGGGEGSQTAAPVARDILMYYFGLSESTSESTEAVE